MSDKELLELAAKAAGIDYAEYLPDDDRSVEEQFDAIIKSLWNPLTDDGDALRLAVKLGLWLHIGKYHVAVEGTPIEIDCYSDPYSATRRAIVRAAAEIEKGDEMSGDHNMHCSANQPDKETPLALRLADNLAKPWTLRSDQQKAAAELRRLYLHEQATSVWSEKTEWVQKTAKPGELGMHRADALKKRIDDLTALNAELVEALEEANDSTYSESFYAKSKALIAKAKGESNELL